MTLLELQRRMLGDLLVPLGEGLAETPETRAAEYITDSARLEAAERLAIYRRSYWARVREAVGEDFPVLRTVVGRDRFAALIDAYLLAHPSRSWTLRNLSQSLPDWLAAHPQQAGRRWRAALDAARLEWAYIECFDAASLAPLSPEAVALLTADSPLRFQPHLRLLALDSTVDELVLAVHRKASDEDRTPAPSPILRRAKLHLAVHRIDGVVYYRRLDRNTFRMLDAVQQSQTLAEAVERFLQSFAPAKPSPAAIESIRQTLALAAQLGWFAQSQ